MYSVANPCDFNLNASSFSVPYFNKATASSDSCSEEFSIYKKILLLWSFAFSQKESHKKLFQDTVTNVAVNTTIISEYQEEFFHNKNIAQGRLETIFIDREDLHTTVFLAESLIDQIFDAPPRLSFNYCCDHGEETIEWLDMNLSYTVAEDAEIESLLDKMDELNDAFSDKVDSSKELLFNFHLDIT